MEIMIVNKPRQRMENFERIKTLFRKQRQGFTPKPVPVPKTYRKLLLYELLLHCLNTKILYHRLCRSSPEKTIQFL